MESQVKGAKLRKSWKVPNWKIVVVGDMGVGKSSIIIRHTTKQFFSDYESTIGADVWPTTINLNDERTTLHFWDLAGQERYGAINHCYYRNADGAFIVYDASNPQTFNSVLQWKYELDKYTTGQNEPPIPCILLANKCDLKCCTYENSPSKMIKFCEANGFETWFETSAKDGRNIDESIKLLIDKMVDRHKEMPKYSKQTISLVSEKDINKFNCEC